MPVPIGSATSRIPLKNLPFKLRRGSHAQTHSRPFRLSSMIVDDTYIVRLAILPSENNSPLIVDSNRVGTYTTLERRNTHDYLRHRRISPGEPRTLGRVDQNPRTLDRLRSRGVQGRRLS